MSSSTSTSRMIKLKSSDDEIFIVDETIAEQSVTIKNFFDDDVADDVMFPLPNVEAKILKMVIEWLKKHADTETETETGAEKKDLGDWEKEFVEIDLILIYDLINAANYLGVNDLLHRLCQKVADMIKGKQPEEIREIFNIENDFTPEEEAEIKKQNAWVFESVK